MPPVRTVRDYIPTIPDFPHKGIMFRDVTTPVSGPARAEVSD
jgi:adenine phosphoribosyltransferase